MKLAGLCILILWIPLLVKAMERAPLLVSDSVRITALNRVCEKELANLDIEKKNSQKILDRALLPNATFNTLVKDMVTIEERTTYLKRTLSLIQTLLKLDTFDPCSSKPMEISPEDRRNCLHALRHLCSTEFDNLTKPTVIPVATATQKKKERSKTC